jgi:hypothetical protein
VVVREVVVEWVEFFKSVSFYLIDVCFYMSVCVCVRACCASYTKSKDSFLVYKNYIALPLSFSLSSIRQVKR